MKEETNQDQVECKDLLISKNQNLVDNYYVLRCIKSYTSLYKKEIINMYKKDLLLNNPQ